MAPKTAKSATTASQAANQANEAAKDASNKDVAIANAPTNGTQQGKPSLIHGAVEAFGAQLFFTLTAAFVGQSFRQMLAGNPFSQDIIGALRPWCCCLAFSLLYGQRFRPTADPSQASICSAKG